MKIMTFIPSQSHWRNMDLPWILILTLKVHHGLWIIYQTPCLLFSYPPSLNNLFLLSGPFLMWKMKGMSALQLQVSPLLSDCHISLFCYSMLCFFFPVWLLNWVFGVFFNLLDLLDAQLTKT